MRLGSREDIMADKALCLGCGKAPIEYQCMPCRHKVWCKRCAMKFATGKWITTGLPWIIDMRLARCALPKSAVLMTALSSNSAMPVHVS